MTKDHKVDIVLILGVKMSKRNLKKWPTIDKKGEKYVYSEATGALGGITTMWNP